MREPVLVCPGCAARSGSGARFCSACGLPLVFDGAGQDDSTAADGRVSDRRWALQRIKPQLAEGPLVKVAWVRNQAEGEFVQGLLLEQGVPSLLRRTAGFDVPDMLAAGPRDVLVPAAGGDVASETLLGAGVSSQTSRVVSPTPPPGRLLAGLCLALAAGMGLICLVYLVVR